MKLPKIFYNCPQIRCYIDYAENDEFKNFTTFKIKLTNSCNLKCGYCYFHFKDSFISDENIQKIKSEIQKFKGKKKIILCGGEPTLHPKFYEIVNDFKNLGDVEVQTNWVKDINFSLIPGVSFRFTIHSTSSWHGLLLKRLKEVQKLKLNYVLVLLVSADNQDKITVLYKLLKPYYNVRLEFVFQDVWKIKNEILKLKQSEKITLSRKGLKLKVGFQNLIAKNLTCFYGYNCTAGSKHFVIDSNGDVYKCLVEHFNKNKFCNIDEMFSKSKEIHKCESWWCVDFKTKITNPRFKNF